MRRAFLMASLAGWTLAQPAFEVASVKVAPPQQDGSVAMKCSGGPGTADPERLTCDHAALSMLVVLAYNIPFYDLKAPDWMNWGGSAGGYDVVAKIPAATTKDQYRLMLQNLLADRFHLAVHREKQERSEYAVLAGKSGVKLVRSSEEGPPAGQNPFTVEVVKGHLRITARRASVKSILGLLTVYSGSAVADEAGLDGEYGFTLEFAPDQRWRGFQPSTELDDAQSLEVALRDQLGLRLEKARRVIEILMVDRADKVPTAN